MNSRILLHCTWLIPLALTGLLIQQLSVFYGIRTTFNEGDELKAYITDFRIKQIAAQTNGYVDLMFTDETGTQYNERLSLHAQHASRLIGANEIDIRFRKGAAYDIVITDTYEYHKSTVLINMAVIGLSLLVFIPVSVFASRYAAGKVKGMRKDKMELEFEHS